MRDLSTFLHDYGDSHRHPVNQWVHIFCVPAIFVSTLGLFWLIPVGQWLGLEGAAAYWVNGGTLLAVLCMPSNHSLVRRPAGLAASSSDPKIFPAHPKILLGKEST